MTDWGLHAEGLAAPSYDEVLTEVTDALHARISPRLVVDGTTAIGQISTITCYHHSLVWQALATLVAGLDPDQAGEETLPSLAKLTGVIRGQATAGTCPIVLTWTGAAVVPALAITVGHAAEASNLWTNLEAFSVPGAGDVTVVFSATVPGAVTALAGTLTRIVVPYTGVSAATNLVDATPGLHTETIEDLRIRRRNSPAATGGATTRSIQAAVGGVPGVVDCRVLENDSDITDGYGIPAHQIHALVWDGTGEDAADADIAAALFTKKAGGVRYFGDAEVAVADPAGGPLPVMVRWSRVEQVPVTIVCTVTGTATEAAILAALTGYSTTVGSTVVWSKLLAAVTYVPGVGDVTELLISRDADPPAAANVSTDITEIPIIAVGTITITVVPA